MSRIRGLELLFNLEKTKLKSKEDCIVAVFHCLLINENVQCAGIGDEWPEGDSALTELLPGNWNNNQDMYSLRYTSKDKKTRILLKLTKMDHILQVDAALNEDAVASMPVLVSNYVNNDFAEYSTAYKDLDSLAESFRENIMQALKPKETSSKTTNTPSSTHHIPSSARNPQPPPQRFDDSQKIHFPRPPSFPRVGGSDLDPFGGRGGGGMLMDPSSFGIPARPSLPQFGVGGPGGLPAGAVPPGARFDPFMPPIRPDRRNRYPDEFGPPDFEDFM